MDPTWGETIDSRIALILQIGWLWHGTRCCGWQYRVSEAKNARADGAEIHDAEEASIPTPQFPTDGANEEGGTSTIPMVRDPGFVREKKGAGGLLSLV